MAINSLERELKRGSTEVLILALLEERDRHGYDLARLIDERSGGAISFHAASLYPTLYRMEEKDLIEGRWIEKAGKRRRRYYRVTAAARIPDDDVIEELAQHARAMYETARADGLSHDAADQRVVDQLEHWRLNA